MTIKYRLLTAAASAALAFPVAASAQIMTDVGATVSVATPAEQVEAVQDQVEAATDTVADTADRAVAADSEVGVAAEAQAGDTQVVAATSADVTAGATVRDTAGSMVGTIESVSASGAVVATGKSRVQIPVTSFGKNDRGLVLAMSKTELDAAAAAATPS